MHVYKMYIKCIFSHFQSLGIYVSTMQLNKQTDFAFRVLLYLGQVPAGELAHVAEICDFYEISHNHVAKVVLRLTKLGYVRSVRGHGGGIQLLAAPEEINVAQVIRDFETSLRPVNCIEPKCRLVPGCKLKAVLFDAMDEFLKSTATYTLADLLPD